MIDLDLDLDLVNNGRGSILLKIVSAFIVPTENNAFLEGEKTECNQ